METKKLSLSVNCFNSVSTQNKTFFSWNISFLGNYPDFEKQAKNFDPTFCTGIYHDKSMSVQTFSLMLSSSVFIRRQSSNLFWKHSCKFYFTTTIKRTRGNISFCAHTQNVIQELTSSIKKPLTYIKYLLINSTIQLINIFLQTEKKVIRDLSLLAYVQNQTLCMPVFVLYVIQTMITNWNLH